MPWVEQRVTIHVKKSMNKSLIDSNILIYAHDTDSPFHAASYNFIKQQVQKELVCFTFQNLVEAYRIWTQKLRKPISPKQAVDILNYYLSSDIPVLYPTQKTSKILSKLAVSYKIQGVHIFDSLIAALMIENNIKTIYTVNIRDFSGFREISALNPFS